MILCNQTLDGSEFSPVWKFGNNSRLGLQKRVLRAEARSPPNKNPQGINPLGHLGAAL